MPALGKGTTLRGGFGTMFRRLVCVDLRLDCTNCDLRYTCPYTKVFNPFVPPEANVSVRIRTFRVRLRLNHR